MCQYCKDVFTEDANDDMIMLDIKLNGRRMLGIQTYLGDCDGKAYAITLLDDKHGRYIAYGKLEIHYCPVCGRKLLKES